MENPNQNINATPPPPAQPPADINGNHKDLDTHTLIGILLLAFIYPIGLIFMWFMTKWPKWVKLLLTVPVLFIILGLILVWYSYYVLSSNGFYNTTGKSSTNSAQHIIPSPSPTPDSTAADKTANWKTYTNQKYGYEINIPYNWFRDTGAGYNTYGSRDNFQNQNFSAAIGPFCAGGPGYDVNIQVLPNPQNMSATDYLNQQLRGQNGTADVKILKDRMGIPKDIDAVISEGYPGSGFPGPKTDINVGHGKIVEITTEEFNNLPVLKKIISSFRLIDPDSNAKDLFTDVLTSNGNLGDIRIITDSSQKLLTNWGYNYNPILSPDKTKVAYLSETKESVAFIKANPNKSQTSNNVWIVNSEGSNPIQVTSYINNVFRNGLHWLDNDRLMYTDGRDSLKVYSLNSATTQTVIGPNDPITYTQNPGYDPYFLYNSDFSYLVKLPGLIQKPTQPITIVNLSTLETINSLKPMNLIECGLEFGSDNTTFIGDHSVLDLKTGKVTSTK